MVANLLVAAAGCAFGYLYHRQGGSRLAAVLFVALLVLGSALPFMVLAYGLTEVGPVGGLWISFALVVSALLTAYSPERAPAGDSGKLYGEFDGRRLFALFLMSAAAAFSPVCLPLLVPVLLAVPPEERQGGSWKRMIAIALGAAALIGAWHGYQALKAPQEILTRLDPGLLGWNLSYLFAGANFGLLVWFLPAVLLIACYRRGSRRGWLVVSVLVGTLAVAVVSAWDLRGAEEVHVNGSFLPLYGALWFVPNLVPRAPWQALTAVATGLFLWPAWISPLATAAGEDRPAAHERSLASRLLYETTQEAAPFTAEWKGTGVLSRAIGPGLVDGEEGPALVPSAGPAELMIAAERPLEAVLLDFGPEATTELAVVGGTTGNTVFQPDGGVRFEIVLGEPSRTHPMWFSPKRHYIYLLEIEMSGAPDRPLPVAIMARPREALPRSLDPSTAGQEL